MLKFHMTVLHMHFQKETKLIPLFFAKTKWCNFIYTCKTGAFWIGILLHILLCLSICKTSEFTNYFFSIHWLFFQENTLTHSHKGIIQSELCLQYWHGLNYPNASLAWLSKFCTFQNGLYENKKKISKVACLRGSFTCHRLLGNGKCGALTVLYQWVS